MSRTAGVWLVRDSVTFYSSYLSSSIFGLLRLISHLDAFSSAPSCVFLSADGVERQFTSRTCSFQELYVNLMICPSYWAVRAFISPTIMHPC